MGTCITQSLLLIVLYENITNANSIPISIEWAWKEVNNVKFVPLPSLFAHYVKISTQTVPNMKLGI